MIHPGLEKGQVAARGVGLPRLMAQLWGTTTFPDALAAARLILSPGGLVQGPAIEKFENAFAQRVGTRYGRSFSAGRVAMYGILEALGIGPGDEVLLQVPTHIVVANAIRFTGATPVFVDCQLDSYNMDLAHAGRRVTPRTKALVLQHTFGIPADLDAAQELARRHNLILIEDCVHALGATYHGRPVGSFGRAAFFSTEETKIISSTMGGMAVTNDPDLAARLAEFQERCAWPSARLVRRYLLKFVAYYALSYPYIHRYTRPVYMRMRKDPRTHLAPGATDEAERFGRRPPDYLRRFSNGQAVIALRQLGRLDANLRHRRAVAEAYTQRLAGTGIRTPWQPEDSQPAWVRYPLWAEDREVAVKELSRHTVVGQWFNSVLEESAEPSCGGYVPGTCPRAEAAAEHLINLPTHLRVGRRDIEAITWAAVRGDRAARRGE